MEKSMAMIRSIEIQIGQMAKQIAQTTKGLGDKFLANTITNPKEHCNNVVTEKEKKNEKEGERDKKEREKKRSKEKKIKEKMKIRREVLLKNIYHILMLLQKKKKKKKKFFF